MAAGGRRARPTPASRHADAPGRVAAGSLGGSAEGAQQSGSRGSREDGWWRPGRKAARAVGWPRCAATFPCLPRKVKQSRAQGWPEIGPRRPQPPCQDQQVPSALSQRTNRSRKAWPSKISVEDAFLSNFQSSPRAFRNTRTHLHQKKLMHSHSLGQLRQGQLHEILPVTLVQKLPEERV